MEPLSEEELRKQYRILARKLMNPRYSQSDADDFVEIILSERKAALEFIYGKEPESIISPLT